MNPSLFVPIEEMMEELGWTEIQIRKDIKAELLPGRIHRRQTIVLRSEWNAYLAGDWKPRKPVNFIHHLPA